MRIRCTPRFVIRHYGDYTCCLNLEAELQDGLLRLRDFVMASFAPIGLSDVELTIAPRPILESRPTQTQRIHQWKNRKLQTSSRQSLNDKRHEGVRVEWAFLQRRVSRIPFLAPIFAVPALLSIWI
jgi:hypothetical protein